jgi:GT2 family glycosyltransferase
MKFGIGIPTLNRADLLSPALKLYQNDFFNCDIFVCDNGNQNIKEIGNIIVINNKENVGVGASWNQLCDKIFEKNDYALILNDDIYLGKNKKEIEKTIKKRPKAFLTATPDWCAFIIPKNIWTRVGRFDECFFPAYYEDNSYAYRMKLKNQIHIKTPELNPFVYRSSQTLEKEVGILEARKRNKELYIEMWGGEPLKETYTKPYGQR